MALPEHEPQEVPEAIGEILGPEDEITVPESLRDSGIENVKTTPSAVVGDDDDDNSQVVAKPVSAQPTYSIQAPIEEMRKAIKSGSPEDSNTWSLVFALRMALKKLHNGFKLIIGKE